MALKPLDDDPISVHQENVYHVDDVPAEKDAHSGLFGWLKKDERVNTICSTHGLTV